MAPRQDGWSITFRRMLRRLPALAALLVAAGCVAPVSTPPGGQTAPTAAPEATQPAGATTAPSTTRPPSSSRVLVAAGDLVCSPDNPDYNGGRGTATACRATATAELAESLDPDDVLPLGDLQYEVGALAEFQAAYELSWGRFNDIVHPVTGNHEYDTPGAAGYFDYFGSRAGPRGKGWYSYDIAGWHVVVLNGNCGAVGGCTAGSPQGKWLAADLAAHPDSCLLAAWHQPRFSSSGEGGTQNTDGLWRAVNAAGADLVLNGHRHHYERSAPLDADGNPASGPGTVEIVAGTGGETVGGFGAPRVGSLVRLSQFGVLELTLAEGSYTARFVALGGRVLDTTSGTC